MKILKILTLAVAILVSGCAEVMQIAQQTLEGETPLTQSEIIAGLKEALITGTNNSVDILGVQDGYYKDEMVKILLPPEADIIVNNIGKVPGGDQLFEDVLLKINRAAEDAAKEAAPIFVNSIKSMTINDAVGILKGDNNAATTYLHKTTYDQLFKLYQPKIKTSVEKELVGGVSTKESWDTLVGKWNQVAGSFIGQTTGLKEVDTQLEDYLTQKALEGVFLKIAEEEKQIRQDPAARVTSLLRKVFGSVDA
ncbi:MAG TPA: DUF4197 domain-containing protein [Draconibacterium sp.]|nr:DUF4197 domain-containing protein [Draconibacterium sp.]